MANREMRKCKADRDRAFAELVCKRIFKRTGGIARAWLVLIASTKRLQFLVGTVTFRYKPILPDPPQFD